MQLPPNHLTKLEFSAAKAQEMFDRRYAELDADRARAARRAMDALARQLIRQGEPPFGSAEVIVARYNDAEDRQLEDVLALFDDTIAEMEREIGRVDRTMREIAADLDQHDVADLRKLLAARATA
jgi:hypothetical protein